MVKMWRETEEESAIKGSIMEAGLAGIEAMEGAVPSGWESTPLKELRKEPASKFVKTQQRWCPNWVAESRSKANVGKEQSKVSFKTVLDAINQNYKGPFGVDDILNWLNARNISEGELQRRILSYMVCLGILEVRHLIVKKDDKNKPKYIFIKKEIIAPCSYLSSGRCSFDWKKGAITDYFPPKYSLEEQSPDSEI